MNELEEQNVQGYRVRSAVLVLLARGTLAWCVFAGVSLLLDELPLILERQGGVDAAIWFLNGERVVSAWPWSHFVLNFLYGFVMMFLVLNWLYEYYLIRPDGVVVRRGILFSREDVYQMEDIKTITVHQGLFGKLFNIGTVRFYAHRAQRSVAFQSIDDPHKMAAHMHALHPAPETVQVK